MLWPVSRADVEAFVLNKTEALADGNPHFHQPHVIDFDKTQHTLTLTYIPAEPLSVLCCEKAPANTGVGLPSVHQLTELLRFLHRINHLPYDSFSADEKRLLDQQLEIVQCMYHNKMKDICRPLTGAPWYFCLGDVSLNNILFDGDCFTLLDFECAHMGYAGYDIGQLLGMARVSDSLLAERLIQALKTAVPDEAERALILIWADRFEQYYAAEGAS
ncbi:MAG: phosphotransferase [Lachnospiraceae bacterium]|nr:phosphotransferase [Lachnospiraceae bacterium]